MPTSKHAQPEGTITLAEALAEVYVTPGQASAVMYALSKDLGDADPALRAAFIAGADEVVKPPDAPPPPEDAKDAMPVRRTSH